MKTTLTFLAALAAAANAHAFSYLRLADTNYAVTNSPTAGEPQLAVWTQAEAQRLTNIIHNETDRLAFLDGLVIEATYDDTPTPFLEVPTPDDNYQLWSFGIHSPTANRGLVRNLGQVGWCLAALQSGPGRLTMVHCDATDPLQIWQLGEEVPTTGGSSPAEVVARAVCQRGQ